MAADYNTKINFHYSSRDMIYEKDIYPPLLELIKESNGEMLFVDEITFAANKRTPRLYSLI